MSMLRSQLVSAGRKWPKNHLLQVTYFGLQLPGFTLTKAQLGYCHRNLISLACIQVTVSFSLFSDSESD